MKKLKLISILIPYILLSQEFGNDDITIFDESVLSIINKNEMLFLSPMKLVVFLNKTV